jgi:hypothetical protein
MATARRDLCSWVFPLSGVGAESSGVVSGAAGAGMFLPGWTFIEPVVPWERFCDVQCSFSFRR